MMNELSSYEKLRLKNIEENKKMLESLGLLHSFKPVLNPIKRKKAPSEVKKKAVKRSYAELVVQSEDKSRKRRSLRIKGVEPDGSMIEEDDDEEYKPKTPKIKRDNFFGHIEGIPVGTHWESRIGCSADGIHRPTVAGIHGNEDVGCYSLALSGGYEDDIDLGESFTYTGSGGRDLKGTKANPKNLRTAPQSKDQTLTKMNLALSLNAENRQPVRVIRGYKCPSLFAPEYGYRYDGLYTVEKFWSCGGISGHLVWKYVLKRVKDQEPPPWTEKQEIDLNNNEVQEVKEDEEEIFPALATKNEHPSLETENEQPSVVEDANNSEVSDDEKGVTEYRPEIVITDSVESVTTDSVESVVTESENVDTENEASVREKEVATDETI